jgi:hypothetical protein
MALVRQSVHVAGEHQMWIFQQVKGQSADNRVYSELHNERGGDRISTDRADSSAATSH